MNISLILAIVFAVLLLLFFIVATLSKKIRRKAYKYFLYAEDIFDEDNGENKMDYVLTNLYDYLPSVLKIFITPKILKKIVQKFFEEVSDFLDDGKLNNSENTAV